MNLSFHSEDQLEQPVLGVGHVLPLPMPLIDDRPGNNAARVNLPKHVIRRRDDDNTRVLPVHRVIVDRTEIGNSPKPLRQISGGFSTNTALVLRTDENLWIFCFYSIRLDLDCNSTACNQGGECELQE